MTGVKVGYIVHYVHECGAHCAAIITAIGENTDEGECELQVAIPGFGWMTRQGVLFNPHFKLPGTWHWVEVG